MKKILIALFLLVTYNLYAEAANYDGTYNIVKVVSTEEKQQDRLKNGNKITVKKLAENKYLIKNFSKGEVKNVYTGELTGNILTINTLVQFTIEFTNDNKAIVYLLGDQYIFQKE